MVHKRTFSEYAAGRCDQVVKKIAKVLKVKTDNFLLISLAVVKKQT